MFYGGVIRGTSIAFIFGVAKLVVMYLIILPFTLAGGSFSPGSIITTLSLINVIRITFLVFIVRCFFTVYEAYVAIVRIQVCVHSYLNSEYCCSLQCYISIYTPVHAVNWQRMHAMCIGTYYASIYFSMTSAYHK